MDMICLSILVLIYICVCTCIQTNDRLLYVGWRIYQHLLVAHIRAGFVKAETQVFPVFLIQTRNLTKAHRAFLAWSSFFHAKLTNGELSECSTCSVQHQSGGIRLESLGSAHTFTSLDIPVDYSVLCIKQF